MQDSSAPLVYNFNRSNRVLACRPHVKAFYYFMTGAASLWLLLGLASIATFGLNDNQHGVYLSAILGFSLPLSLLLLARFLIYPIANLRVEIKAHSLLLRRDEREIEIKFSDIEKVDLSHIPFTAGWMKIHVKDGLSYSLNVALERSEYILDALVQFNPKLISADKVHHYRLTAIYYDHSWARLIDRVKNSRKLIVKYGLTSFILPIAYYVSVIARDANASPNIFMMLLMMVGAFVCLSILGAVLWFLSELLILAPVSRRTLKVDAHRPVRNVEFERRVELLVDFAYFLIVIAALIALS